MQEPWQNGCPDEIDQYNQHTAPPSQFELICRLGWSGPNRIWLGIRLQTFTIGPALWSRAASSPQLQMKAGT